MDAAYILLILAVVAGLAVMLVYRTTSARPDHPMAGAEDDLETRRHGEAAGQEASWTADRPGDPGQEGMDPTRAGDPSAGPPNEQRSAGS